MPESIQAHQRAYMTEFWPYVRLQKNRLRNGVLNVAGIGQGDLVPNQGKPTF
jgi:hypothetical protein